MKGNKARFPKRHSYGYHPVIEPRIHIVEVFVPLEESERDDLAVRAGRALGLPSTDLTEVRVVRRSLDARKGRPVGYRLRLEACIGAVARPCEELLPRGHRGHGLRVVIAGSGPAGTFAALRLAREEAEVTVLELGKPVKERRHDIADLVRHGQLDPTSNYCFGEGGAGTFSDGKLFTRTKDRGAVAKVLGILVDHGADPGIRIDSRPHIGSNRLPVLVSNLRHELETLGVKYLFSDPLTDLCIENKTVRGARLRSGVELSADALILATGHSARELYARLVTLGVKAEAKPFAVGVRVEHPQELIDEIQYGRRDERLPPAFYQLTAKVLRRGVYSFCMCPGGWIVNSSTEPGHLATNGMSLNRRNSPYANAALVVNVERGDLDAENVLRGIDLQRELEAENVLRGIDLQRELEARAFDLGGGDFAAPAQRLVDFLANRASSRPLRSSYRPRVVAGDLASILPAFVRTALIQAIPVLARTMRGFLSEEAQLVGVETRTSAPVRLLRHESTCESLSHAGLYPCGEGAGYAGGIVSAAIDGLRVADAILAGKG